jgi:hypothetical protein
MYSRSRSALGMALNLASQARSEVVESGEKPCNVAHPRLNCGKNKTKQIRFVPKFSW